MNRLLYLTALTIQTKQKPKMKSFALDLLRNTSHLRLTVGRLGTPPGVLTVTGWLRSPSPLRVSAATCTEYLVSGCRPEMFNSSAAPSSTSNLIGSFNILPCLQNTVVNIPFLHWKQLNFNTNFTLTPLIE